MKFSIERNALLRSLNHVQAVVERRSSIPILSNVRLKALGEELEMMATDMDVSILAKEPAQVDKAGETTVSAHLLFDIVRKLPDGSAIAINLEDNNELSIKAGRSVFNLPCLASEEFPAFEETDLDIRFSVGAAALAELIDKTKFAISTEETRYYLNGIYFHVWNEGATSMLRGVATDGHRLARAECGLPKDADNMPPIIVPRKTVGEMRKLLGDSTQDVMLAVSSRRIQLTVDRTVLSSRLIEGSFPDYERVIPSGNNLAATMDTAAMTAAVDRVATVASDKARAVKLSFEPGKAGLSAFSSDTARAFEEIECDYDGSTVNIGFNARYVLDMLECVDGDKVTLQFSDPGSPTLARDPDNGALLFVLMPMRV